jgi:hypothetical protein
MMPSLKKSAEQFSLSMLSNMDHAPQNLEKTVMRFCRNFWWGLAYSKPSKCGKATLPYQKTGVDLFRINIGSF